MGLKDTFSKYFKNFWAWFKDYISEMRYALPTGCLLIFLSAYGLIWWYSLEFLGIVLFNIIIASLTLLVWWKYAPRIAISLGHFLTKNFIGKKLVGGSEFYLERKGLNYKTWFPFTLIFSRIILLITAWIGTTLFIVNLPIVAALFPLEQFRIEFWINPTRSYLEILPFIFLISIIPALLVFLIPTSWCLYDSKLKAWDKKTKTNWFISQKFLVKFSFITSAGAVGSTVYRLLRENVDILSNIFNFLLTSFLLTIFAAILISTFYLLIFSRGMRKALCETLDFRPALTVLQYLDEIEEEFSEEVPLPTDFYEEESLEEPMSTKNASPPQFYEAHTERVPNFASKPSLQTETLTERINLGINRLMQVFEEKWRNILQSFSGLLQGVTTQKQICPHCQHAIDSDSKYCTFCGKDL